MRQLARTLPLSLCALAAALLLNACGGGDAAPPPSPNQTSGFAVDGYLAGASVLCDSNGDGLVTPGETSVNTTSAGLFSFSEGCPAGLVITGGTNSDTGLPFVGMLKGNAGSKAVTPLTTLLVHGMSQDQLNSALGLPAGTDVANTDPAATDGAGTLLNETLFKKTLAVQQLLQKTSEVLNGLTTPVDQAAMPAIYNEVAAAFAEFLKGGAKLNLSDTVLDVAVVGNLVNAAALRVASAPALSVPVRAAAQSVNSQALAGVTASSLKIQAEAILVASGAAAITAETLQQQGDPQITTYVAANKAALGGTPSAESVASMNTALTQQVTASQSGGGGGGGGGGGSDGAWVINWDAGTPPELLSSIGAYGDGSPSVETGPTNGSGNALKIARTGAQSFGGTFFTVSPKIPFAADRKTMTARVYSSRAGAVIRFKVQVTDSDFVEVASSPTGPANTWQTLTWNLSGVDPAKTYNVIAISPDVDVAIGGAQTYWIDTITLEPASGGSGSGGGGGGGSNASVITWEADTPAELLASIGAYGDGAPTVEAGPSGGNGNALKIVRSGSQTFGGTFFTVAPKIAFAADRKIMTARVYSSRAGAVIRLKVQVTQSDFVEVASAPTGPANTWQTLTWNMAGVDPAKTYNVIAISPDVDVVIGGAQTYWVDDITLVPPSGGAGGSSTLPITWDAGTSADLLTSMGAYGDGAPSVEAGPSGGDGSALKLARSGTQNFGGTFFTVSPKIAFAADRKTITARVNSSRAGAVIRFKVQVTQSDFVEVSSAPTGPANTWQTLTWNLNGVDPAKSYNVIAITPDVDVTLGGAQTYWIDDITLAPAGSGGSSTTPVTIATLEEPTASLTGFEGCWDSTLVNDPAGGTNKVGKVVKPGSGVPFYCGTTVVTVLNGGFTPIAFTAGAQTMTVRVWSPDNVGTPVRLKVEDIADAAKFVEADALTTVQSGWQTLTFNFAAPALNSPALNLATTYNKVSIFFDFDSVGTGRTYYFDDVVFVTGTGTNTSVVTFDERNYNNTQSEPAVLLGFGGAEDSTIVGGASLPTGSGGVNGKVAKVVKNAGQPWAGTSMQRRANDAVPTIPFAPGATKMTVRVYSAYAGVRVHLKVEQSGRPDINSEVNACTTLTNAWETLTFDFGPAGKHFVPGGPCPNGHNTNLPTAQLDVSKVHNKVNIFFDYGLGDAGWDAMPEERTYYFDEVKFIGN